MVRERIPDPSAPGGPELIELADALDFGLFSIDASGCVTWANEAFARQYGYASVGEAIGSSAIDHYVDPLERQRTFAQFLSDPMVSERGVIRFEAKRVRKNSGEAFDALISVRVAFAPDGTIERLDGLSEDIGDRKRAERAFLESEERFSRVFDDSVLSMAVTNRQGTILRVNEALCAFLERGRSELMGSRFEDLVHPCDRVNWFPLENPPEEASERSWQTEKRFVRRSGEFCWGYATITRLSDSAGTPSQAVVMVQDITVRKRMEVDLLRVAKLESLAVLSGGIAHDFNNILTALLGHLSVVCTDVRIDDSARRHIEEAQSAALRARALTQQLITFAKGGAPVRKAGSVTSLLKSTAQFCLSGSNVLCEFHFDEDLPLVEFDAGQMSQALHNILLNADEAMASGGTIMVRVSTESVEPDSPLPLEAGRYVRIDIRDQGVGIPEACLSRVFDPYFSTKQTGSGLGLATAYSIVRKHEGHISATSRVDEGSTFSVYLPSMVAQTERPSAVRPATSDEGAARVLIMDDEEAVREVAAAILVGSGFDVTTVADGDAALKAYGEALESDAPFDLVILDLTVPAGRGGAETIGLLRELDPDVVALVSSGYSADEVMASYRDHGFRGIVPKPYTAEELRTAVGGAVTR